METDTANVMKLHKAKHPVIGGEGCGGAREGGGDGEDGGGMGGGGADRGRKGEAAYMHCIHTCYAKWHLF
jgi:hypothetical protein